MTHILAPKHTLEGHCLYVFVDTNSNTFCVANSLFDTFRPNNVDDGIYLWKLTNSYKPLSFYIDHPDVIVYTPDSHPEYFL